MNPPNSKALELADAIECEEPFTSIDRTCNEAAAELRRLAAENEALLADAERLKEHAVTLANTTFLATLERCAQLCESHFNHEAKDCAEEIRALKDQA